MLKLEFKDSRQKPFWIMGQSFSVGSGRDNNLVIDDPSVLETHARFISQGDSFSLKALDEHADLEVNGQPVTQINVGCGDDIRIGMVELQIVDPLEDTQHSVIPYWSLIADSSWLSGQEFPLNAEADKALTLGRGSQCDIVFAGTHLSRKHAEISIGKDCLTIRDLNSANGTFVNDKRVSEAQLKPGDRVRLDVYSFRVFGPGIDLPSTSTTARFAAVTTDDAGKANARGEKAWITRPTSPGNREEPSQHSSKVFAWLSGLLILSLFGIAVYIVLTA